MNTSEARERQDEYCECRGDTEMREVPLCGPGDRIDGSTADETIWRLLKGESQVDGYFVH